MPYLNISASSANNIVAQATGKSLSDLNRRVAKALESIVNSISQKCPSEEEAIEIKAKLTNIRSIILSVKQRSNSFTSISSRISPLLPVLSRGITLLKSIPIPAQFVSVGLINTYSDNLHTLRELQKQLSDQAAFLNTTLNGTGGILSLVEKAEETVRLIDSILQRCVEGEETIDIQDRVVALENSEQFNYRGYVLEVLIVDPDEIAPLRQVVAKDSFGIIRFRGDQSYSSSVEILIEEIKFIIDNELS